MGSKIWKYGFILIIQLYLTGVSYAQIKVEVRVLEKVNALRDSLNLNPLKLDSVLYNAGKDQAYYMANYNKLGHFQKTFTKPTLLLPPIPASLMKRTTNTCVKKTSTGIFPTTAFARVIRSLKIKKKSTACVTQENLMSLK